MGAAAVNANLDKAARQLSGQELVGVDPMTILSLVSLLQGILQTIMAGCAPEPEKLAEYLNEKVPPFRARRRENRVRGHIAKQWKATGGDPAKLVEVQEQTLAAIREGKATLELIQGCYADVRAGG